jgi:uncharacterized iron-regulated membrane protein
MNALRLVHRWVGLALALVVAAVALSGGLLLFRDSYFRLVYPALEEPITADQAGYRAEVLATIERRWHDVGVQLVKFPQPRTNGFLVWLRDGRQAWVHPKTADTIDEWRWFEQPPALLFELHAHLFAERPGTVVNGIAALSVVFMSLTGAVLWWPARKGFRLRGAIPWRVTAAHLIRSHATTGVLSAIPIVLFAGTGAAMAFYEPTAQLMARWFDDRAPEEPTAYVPPGAWAPRPWSELLPVVDGTFQDGEIIYYYPGTKTNARLMFRKRFQTEWHPNGRTYLIVNPYSGNIVQAIDATVQGPGTQLMHKVYPVHAVTVGGTGLTVAAAIAALGLVWLSGGGAWSYFARRGNIARSRQRGSSETAGYR